MPQRTPDPKNIRTVREALALVGVPEKALRAIVVAGYAPEVRDRVTDSDVELSLSRVVEVPEGGAHLLLHTDGRFFVGVGGGSVLYEWSRVSKGETPYYLANTVALVVLADGVGHQLALVTTA